METMKRQRRFKKKNTNRGVLKIDKKTRERDISKNSRSLKFAAREWNSTETEQ